MASGARKLLPLPEHDPTIPGSPVYSHSDYYVSSSYGEGFSSYRLNPPLDASMALTVLLLLVALFFMGFFSLYIRRFSEDSSSAQRSSDPDSDALHSLPVYICDGAAKQEADCTICLSELEEGQLVKKIPYCGHVFHLECIDAWLGRHLTCPLCRTASLFPPPEELTALDPRGTCSQEDHCALPPGFRRTTSCLLVPPHRLVCLRRSLSC